MSFAFQRHDYNLDEFERCEKHGCGAMQITAGTKPVCLVDWLIERTGHRQMEDVLPREQGAYNSQQ